MVEFLVGSDANLELKDNNGNTALHYAARKGFLPTVECLVKNGAKLEEKNLVPKPVCSLLAMRPNKLGCLPLTINFQSCLTFACYTRSFPRRKHLKSAPIGLALAVPSNSKS